MNLPRCCEREMKVLMETTKFLEASCEICGDMVYVRKESVLKPQLLDD